MKKFFTSIVDALSHQAVRTKIIYTLGILALYRVLVFIPVPFVDIQKLMEVTFQA
jgi:preprotein translocase subunit SecY